MLSPLQWDVLTPDTQEMKFAREDVYFGLTKDGYETLALNHLDISEYIQQLLLVIDAYEQYYRGSDDGVL